ncbi:MAG: hypothetical protein KDA94_16000, partial [Acidimicrobiales bacterium]|nr:hypothetical protein [Acidimicrobiales bacterium]
MISLVEHLVVVRGDAPPATAAIASSLGGDLLVWDEADHHERWRDRPRTFEVRNLAIATTAERWFGPSGEQRATQLALRAHLARRRSAPIIAVGHGALGVATWLRHHRGPRCWVPTTDDLPAIADALVVPAERGGPTTVAVVDDLVVEHDALASIADERWSFLPGWRPTADPGRGGDADQARRIFAFGPADRERGLDHVGRALAAARTEVERRGASVTWAMPPGSAPNPDEVADLRRARVDHLVTFVEHAAPADHELV